MTGIVDALTSSIVAHDNQIEQLIRVAEKHSAQIASRQRQWQSYIKTLPKQ